MYKTLNKKSLIYKSHINTIHTKIQNIGSKEALEARLTQLQSRESDLNSKIIETNNIAQNNNFNSVLPISEISGNPINNNSNLCK